MPEGDKLFMHTSEGPDDIPAPVKAALTQTSLQIPVSGGAMSLGVWQGLFVFEHRTRLRTRTLVVHVLGV